MNPGCRVFMWDTKNMGRFDLDYFREQMAREGVYFDVTALSWPKQGGGTKRDRVGRLGPDFKAHRFFVPYPTHSSGERLTSRQRRYREEGLRHMISRRIVRRDETNRVYDVTERFLLQVSDFPFCQRKDLVDAASRLYDMEPTAPAVPDGGPLEPDCT
jgi:hypothetical protein